MRMFVLDDDPQVIPLANYIIDKGHNVDHAKKPKQVLNDAFLWLAYNPGASQYSRFFFDAAVPPESVFDTLRQRINAYQASDGFNGLRFLLHNLAFVKDRTEHVAIFTAHHNQIRAKEELDVFGRTFLQEAIPDNEIELFEKKEKAPKIRFYFEEPEKNEEALNGETIKMIKRTFTFSLLDKADANIIDQIDRFIING